MSRFHISRPSPALAVATIALIVAMGGTSYAALSLPQNSVGTGQLKHAAVTNGKIRNGAVGTKQIANGAVTKAKLNLTGVTVPSATHASSADFASSAGTANAVGGVNIKQLNVTVPVFGSTTLLDTGLVTLAGTCDRGLAGVTLAKDNGAPPEAAGITAAGLDTNTVINHGYANLIGPVSIDGGFSSSGSVIHAEVGTISGKSTTIDMLAHDAPAFYTGAGDYLANGDVCLFSGSVMFN